MPSSPAMIWVEKVKYIRTTLQVEASSESVMAWSYWFIISGVMEARFWATSSMMTRMPAMRLSVSAKPAWRHRAATKPATAARPRRKIVLSSSTACFRSPAIQASARSTSRKAMRPTMITEIYS